MTTYFIVHKNTRIPVARAYSGGESRTILEWNDAFLDLDDLAILYDEYDNFISKENLLAKFSKTF